MQNTSETSRFYLVTGGSGFLGHYIVEFLLKRGNRVRVFDLIQTFQDSRAEFFSGNICNKSSVLQACVGIDTVFHVAALSDALADSRSYHEVNVQGTKNLHEACLSCNVTQFVYTSTSSVVIDGCDIQNGSEELPYPNEHLDLYSATKAQAEQFVTAANGELNACGRPLFTCSLRPHAIFGPRDDHFIARLVRKGRNGEITHIIGDGCNYVDFTFVENVAHAHLLAADRLCVGSPVCGSFYFITNGEPCLFWDFIGHILKETGCVCPRKFISSRIAYLFAVLMEVLKTHFGWIISFSPTITRHMVFTMSRHHWFSHARASRDFGYRPLVSLREAVARTVAALSLAPLPPLGPTTPSPSQPPQPSPPLLLMRSLSALVLAVHEDASADASASEHTLALPSTSTLRTMAPAGHTVRLLSEQST